MKNDTTPHVEIKPYNANDLSLGVALARVHGEVVEAETLISSAFSLYFQWPKHRDCHIKMNSLSKAIQCVLTYDTDEASPSELRITLPDKNILGVFSLGAIIEIQFEVFNVAYLFESKVTCIENDESSEFQIITEVPKSLLVHKQRALPRHTLQEPVQGFWLGEGDSQGVTVSLLELGINSVKIKRFDSNLPRELSGEKNVEIKGTFTLDQNKFQGTLVGRDSESSIIQLHFKDNPEFGKYFDFYRTFVFPTLKPRSEIPAEEVFEAYLKTGFLDKYVNTSSPEEKAKYFEELAETWRILDCEKHQNKADYCSLNTANEVVGSSSVCNAFRNNQKEVWAFHQFCVLSEPQYFKNTEELYLWRVTYFSGLIGNFDSIVWYDGNSRWLERVWVKLSVQLKDIKEVIFSIQTRIWSKKNSTTGENEKRYPIEKYKIGQFGRKYISSSGAIASIMPNYLNFGKLLNHAVGIPPYKKTTDELISLAKNIVADEEVGTTLRITASTEKENGDDYNELPQTVLTRLCYFNKIEMPYLFSSIIHSIAVMKMKNNVQ